MNCEDYREIISAHVDGKLLADETVEVESHLDQCLKCKQIFGWETKAANALKRCLPPIAPRYELKQRLLGQLGETDGGDCPSWFRVFRPWAFALSFLLIVGTIYSYWTSRAQSDIFADTIIQYQQATQGLKKFSQPHDATLTARLLDLSPWGYQLLERRIYQIRGQESRVFVYQGNDKELLVAQELDGGSLPRPPGSSIFQKSGRDFVSISQGGLHLVAWRDKNVVCVLVSNLPRDRMVALAEQIATRL
jgi:anti-sigma factor RsiW